MKNVPHWQWLLILYLLLVAMPVLYIHQLLKKRTLHSRTFGNLFIYFAGVLGSGFLLHWLAMFLYFTFFFTVKR